MKCNPKMCIYVKNGDDGMVSVDYWFDGGSMMRATYRNDGALSDKISGDLFLLVRFALIRIRRNKFDVIKRIQFKSHEKFDVIVVESNGVDVDLRKIGGVSGVKSVVTLDESA